MKLQMVIGEYLEKVLPLIRFTVLGFLWRNKDQVGVLSGGRVYVCVCVCVRVGLSGIDAAV